MSAPIGTGHVWIDGHEFLVTDPDAPYASTPHMQPRARGVRGA